jgi:hypothetical protein
MGRKGRLFLVLGEVYSVVTVVNAGCEDDVSHLNGFTLRKRIRNRYLGMSLGQRTFNLIVELIVHFRTSIISISNCVILQ